jgi:hypothetical protein
MLNLSFSEQDIADAKKISSSHNLKIPSIKELRAKLDLGLREAKELNDLVWDTVEHPSEVKYNGLDRIQPARITIQSVKIERSNLCFYRSDGEFHFIPLSKKTIKGLKDFGVPVI